MDTNNYEYYSPHHRLEAMVGRKLTSVSLNKEKDEVTFLFQDGGKTVFGVEGDCCSHSWVEHLELPEKVNGAEVLDIADGYYADLTNDRNENPVTKYGDYESPEHECLQQYQTRLITDRGEIVLEYRNSSNGYYGGSLRVVE